MDTVLWLCPSLPAETLKWLSSLPILMQKSFWWWQCSDRYIISLFPNLHTPSPPPFSPSLISRMVSVDVKHHVYLSTWHKKELFLRVTGQGHSCFCTNSYTIHKIIWIHTHTLSLSLSHIHTFSLSDARTLFLCIVWSWMIKIIWFSLNINTSWTVTKTSASDLITVAIQCYRTATIDGCRMSCKNL